MQSGIIQIQNNYEKGIYQLIDKSGKIVESTILDESTIQEIHLNYLPKENYFSQINLDGNWQNEQVVKQ